PARAPMMPAPDPAPTPELPTFNALTGTALAHLAPPKPATPVPAPSPPRTVATTTFSGGSSPATDEAIRTASGIVTRTAPPAAPPAPATDPTPLLYVPLRLVGVVGKLYVVLESDRGLVLMDQHAAHERILF